eukprot:GHVU01030279.1.p1 GENE.GHVU01030279.1~~GHVU01030279.1.p1  ORF type:complete len:102 (+),score=5.18 GHVU01030279.1:170-475(+)
MVFKAEASTARTMSVPEVQRGYSPATIRQPSASVRASSEDSISEIWAEEEANKCELLAPVVANLDPSTGVHLRRRTHVGSYGIYRYKGATCLPQLGCWQLP